MKQPILASLALLLTANLFGEIRFAGFSKEDDAYLFSLSDTGLKTGGWYRIGDTFNEMVITNFNRDREQLALTGTLGTFYIELVTSKIGVERKWDGSRSEELAALLKEMAPKMDDPSKLHSAEDYIALCTGYGLIVKRVTRNRIDFVEIEAPDLQARKQSDSKYRIRKFSFHTAGYKNSSAQKINITF